MANKLLRASIISTLVVSLAALDMYLIPPATPSPEFDRINNLGKILEALSYESIRSGDYFTIWSIRLAGSTTGPVLPANATLFVHSNPAVLHLRHVKPAEFDKSLMSYHITPQRLSFEDLLALDPETRIPTLLPSKSIVITSNSRNNFTVDDSRITHPNIYLSPNYAVHGIESTFDYSLYGEGIGLAPRDQATYASVHMPLLS